MILFYFFLLGPRRSSRISIYTRHNESRGKQFINSFFRIVFSPPRLEVWARTIYLRCTDGRGGRGNGRKEKTAAMDCKNVMRCRIMGGRPADRIRMRLFIVWRVRIILKSVGIIVLITVESLVRSSGKETITREVGGKKNSDDGIKVNTCAACPSVGERDVFFFCTTQNYLYS